MLHLERALTIQQASAKRGFGDIFTFTDDTHRSTTYHVPSLISNAYRANFDKTLGSLNEVLQSPFHRPDKRDVKTSQLKDVFQHEIRLWRLMIEDALALIQKEGVKSEHIVDMDGMPVSSVRFNHYEPWEEPISITFNGFKQFLGAMLRQSYLECIRSIRKATLAHLWHIKHTRQPYNTAVDSIHGMLENIQEHMRRLDWVASKVRSDGSAEIPSPYFHDVPYMFLFDMMCSKSVRLSLQAMHNFVVAIIADLHPAVPYTFHRTQRSPSTFKSLLQDNYKKHTLHNNKLHLPGLLWRLSEMKRKLTDIRDVIPRQNGRGEGMIGEFKLNMRSSVQYTPDRHFSFNQLTQYLLEHAKTGIISMQISLDDVLIALSSVRKLQTSRDKTGRTLGSRPEVVQLIENMITKTGMLLRMAQLE